MEAVAATAVAATAQAAQEREAVAFGVVEAVVLARGWCWVDSRVSTEARAPRSAWPT
jgi:hypothetical protein